MDNIKEIAKFSATTVRAESEKNRKKIEKERDEDWKGKKAQVNNVQFDLEKSRKKLQ